MTTEANKMFVRRYLEEVFNRRDFVALDRYADEKFKGGVIELVEKLHGALSGFHITVEDVIVEGDVVVTQETIQGLHSGEYLSPALGVIRPTGKSVTWTRVAVRRIMDGKFARGFYGVALRGEGAELAQLYQQGNQEVIAVVEANFTSGLGLVLLGVSSVAGSIGAILFAIAIWRHGRLPKWTGVLFALSIPLLAFPVTLTTELLGAVLLLISAGVIAWKVWQESVAGAGQ